MAARPNHGAAAPGPAAPVESGDAHALAGGVGVKGKTKDDAPDCAASAAERKAGTADAKRVATLRALFALHGGHVVHEIGDGAFSVTWRAFSRECRDLADLEAHARRVGAMR